MSQTAPADPSQSTATNKFIMVIVAGCLISLVGFGVRASFGVFQEPILVTRGWGSEIFSFAIAVQNLLWGMGQPFAGMIADRYGTAKVLVSGALLYLAGLALMSVSGSPATFQLTAGVMIGLGLSASAFPLVMASFGRLVPPEKRSWAFGIATAAGSAGQVLVVPVSQTFITAYGWQTALIFLAVMIALIIPMATVLAGRSEPPSGAVADSQSLRQALAEAMGHKSFKLLIAGFFVCGFHVAFITVHLPKHLSDQGFSGSTAAWAIATIGLFNIFGSYFAGVAGGHYSKPYLLSANYFCRALAIALFITLPSNEVTVMVFAAVMGLLWLSTVPLTSALVAQMFGPRYLGTLFGIVFFSHQVGSFLGVWLGGRFYDQYGSYDIIWWSGVGLGVLAGLIHLPISERPVDRFVTQG